MSTYYQPVRKGNLLNKYETILLGIVFTLIIAGVIASFIDMHWFEDVYTHEDGFIENFTVFPLSIALVLALSYLFKLGRYRSWMFIASMLFAAVFSLFVAGEEVSWGQRIFHVESSDFFKQNNAQEETNLHNLVVGGKKVNKIVFSLLLGIAVATYLLILPVLYSFNLKVKRFIDWAGIPVPHRNHIFAAILLGILISIIQTAKNAELLEMGITSIFLLILAFPENAHVFRVRGRLN